LLASILLLDEPFSSVDRTTRTALYELLREVSPRIPGPTIYVTHQPDDAIALAESVVTLQRGVLESAKRPWESVSHRPDGLFAAEAQSPRSTNGNQ
jgi:ABC-type sulfate/molybdate transport systems ATPase subunit